MAVETNIPKNVATQANKMLNAIEEAEWLWMMPGTVAVWMFKTDERTESGLLLADKAQKKRVDAGMVLAVGYRDSEPTDNEVLQAKRFGIKPPCPLGYGDLVPGDCVAVNPFKGKKAKRIVLPGGTVVGEVRFYGIGAPELGQAVKVPWHDGIIAKLDVETRMLTPTGDKILLSIGKKPETSMGGVVLPDTVRSRSDFGNVVAVGPLVQDVQVGDTVFFERRGLAAIDAYDSDTALVSESGIYFIWSQD